MKLTTAILLFCCLHLSAKVSSQTISLNASNEKLEKVFAAIKAQTGYTVFFNEALVKNVPAVTITADREPLQQFMNRLLAGHSIDFEMVKKSIVLRKRAISETPLQQRVPIKVQGRVTDEDNHPLAGASVIVQGATKGVYTNRDGYFAIEAVPGESIHISFIGYRSVTLKAAETMMQVTLKALPTALEEVVINKGYYTEKSKLSTGSVSKISSKEIDRQPVPNALAALAGQVPGMMVTQTSGVNGATINVQVRGRNSISQGSDPLFIVDGIPYPNGYDAGRIAVPEVSASGLTMFNNINPSDIESIEVLKDADATAIYGSRGANGVVLVTTKRGKKGKTGMDINISQGFGQVARKLDLLTTPQYLEMRREAFRNDNVAITVLNAPDLMLWDTTRYTDWQDYMIGGMANYTNANLSLSGGNEYTQFVVSANFNQQGSVSPGNRSNVRGTARFNLNHRSANSKFRMLLNGAYTGNKNNLNSDNQLVSGAISRAPNRALPLDEKGELVWEENGNQFTSNPLSYLKEKNQVTTSNFLSNITLDYELVKGLHLKTNAGFNLIQFNQLSTDPRSASSPASTSTAATRFTNNTSQNWIIEPQLSYHAAFNRSTFDVLAGGSLQNDNKQLMDIDAEDFPNDYVLEAAAFAQTVLTYTAITEYRYQAVFGRIHYNFDDRYLINFTARRDGSSRFGPNKRVANFGAVGAAWVFSEEAAIKNNLHWLSFGKLRGSYGVTGNDQIGDYQYLDDYRSSSPRYQGQTGYIPSRLYNPDYTWERNRKMEAAVELGFLEDRIHAGVNWFRNRSDNQLINYALPGQTGFSAVLRNFQALVENAGWEFSISAAAMKQKHFTWNVSGNVTVQRNKLLEFPDLEASSYANTLVIGRPLNISKLLIWQGVDPATGIHTFNGTNRPADQVAISDLTPRFFGGLTNTFRWKNWDFSMLFHFVKQQGNNYLAVGVARPGFANNIPLEIFENRWRKPGDQTHIQRLTTTGAASTAFNNYSMYSNASIADASFARLKNASLSYRLPASMMQRLGGLSARLYMQGQNLFTITNYKGLDPETPLANALPPLRVWTFGMQVNL